MHVGFVRAEGVAAAADRTAELTLAPTTTRVREQIRNAKQAADASPKTADQPARDLIDLGLPLRTTFGLFYGEPPHPAKDILDEVASACVYCLVAHQCSTGDNRTFFQLLQRALPLAETPEVRRRIQDNIKIGKDNWALATLKAIQDSKNSPRQKLQRFHREAVTAIGATTHISAISASFGPLSADPETSPELLESAAIVLRNISLDAWNNHRDQTTAIDANELALQYATKPELRSRLIDDRLAMGHASPPASESTNRYTPPRSASPHRHESNLEILKQHKGFVAAAAIVVVIVLANINSCDGPSPSVTATSQRPPVQATPRWEVTQPIVTPAAQPQYPPRTRSSSAEQTYRITPNLSAELDRDKQAIDTEKAKSARMEALLEASNTEVEAKKAEVDELDSAADTLSRQIERDRIYLDRTSQFEIDSFNLKVDRYNAALRNRKAEVQVFNEMVETHNTMVQQLKTQNRLVNQMVDNYNAKLQQSGR
jgi:hypothetical protein